MTPRDPILRMVPQRSDINSNGHIFGGWVLDPYSTTFTRRDRSQKSADEERCADA